MPCSCCDRANKRDGHGELLRCGGREEVTRYMAGGESLLGKEDVDVWAMMYIANVNQGKLQVRRFTEHMVGVGKLVAH